MEHKRVFEKIDKEVLRSNQLNLSKSHQIVSTALMCIRIHNFLYFSFDLEDVNLDIILIFI